MLCENMYAHSSGIPSILDMPHAYDGLKRPYRYFGGGRKFTSQVAEIATTCAGSVRLFIRVNNSYSLRAGVTQNRARTVLLPTFL
jgi:hypothetical protein